MTQKPIQIDVDALDFAPALLAVQESPPSPMPRVLLYSVSALFAVLLIWAVFGKLDIIAVADGKLVPQSYLKIVQPAEAGIIKEIMIEEGQLVEAGQVLVRLDAQVSQADTRVLEDELGLKALQLRRIDAELAGATLQKQNGEPPELFGLVEAQYRAHRQAHEDALGQEQAALAKAEQDLAAALEIQSKLEQVVPVYRIQAKAFEKLNKEGYAGDLIALDKQRERIEKERDLQTQNHQVASLRETIIQAQKRISQIDSSYRRQLQDERVETEAQYQKLKQEWVKQQHKNTWLELKAPQRGIIKEIATHTRGAVISPGTILMTLVPDDEPLQAEVMIQNTDVGFVHEGQQVKLKLAAYPFQKYGLIDGAVRHVAADSSESAGATNSSLSRSGDLPLALAPYRALIALQAQSLEADGDRLDLSPGMRVAAEIKLGRRTVLEYLLSPVLKAFHEAGRER